MVHSNKLSVIFILLASAIAPVVAPPPPVTSVAHQDGNTANVEAPQASNHPPSTTDLERATREIRKLPRRNPRRNLPTQNLQAPAPNNPLKIGQSAPKSTVSTRHDDEFEQGSSNRPAKRRRLDSDPPEVPLKFKYETEEEKKARKEREKEEKIAARRQKQKESRLIKPHEFQLYQAKREAEGVARAKATLDGVNTLLSVKNNPRLFPHQEAVHTLASLKDNPLLFPDSQ